MNDDQTKTSTPEVPPEPEEEVQDDAIIGRALRWSLLALAVIALLAGAIAMVALREPPPPPEKAIQVSAPQEVEEEVSPPPVAFTAVTREAGIDFLHVNGAEGEKLLPETMGGGAALFDFDNDLDPDLLLVNGRSWPHARDPQDQARSALYRNLGGGRFAEISSEAGLDLRLYGTGVAVGDYDGDGWRDVYVTAVGGNRLLRNRQGRFQDVTAQAGVGGDPGAWSTSAAFLDIDNDGDLDLFVCNYVRWSREIDFEIDYRLTGVGRAYGPPLNYEGAFPYLFRNEGDGTFTDVSAEAGVQVLNPATGVPVAKALGLAPTDVDGDGWIDILVANDTVANFLFHNRGDGTFEEVAEIWGLAYGREGEATGAMGVDAGFYRNDRELGFAIGNFANEMTSLYISQGDPTLFADEAIGEGVGAPTRTMLSFGVLMLDYDLDGRLDLLQTNGHLENEINKVDPSQTYAQPSQLFWNAGAARLQTFVPVPPETTGDLALPIVGRGSATADIDGDGDLDLLLTQTGGRPLLLRNDQRLGHHWLRVRLQSRGPNRDAIGAWIELRSGSGIQRRQVMPTRSYLSQSELPVTFGLGAADSIESLEVRWPDGRRQTVEPLPGIDRMVTIEQEGP